MSDRIEQKEHEGTDSGTLKLLELIKELQRINGVLQSRIDELEGKNRDLIDKNYELVLKNKENEAKVSANQAIIAALQQEKQRASMVDEELSRLRDEIAASAAQKEDLHELKNPAALPDKEGRDDKGTGHVQPAARNDGSEHYLTEGDALLKQILIVHDSGRDFNELKEALKHQNIDVAETDSGEEALKILGNEAFDLVITEIRLKDLSGIFIYRYLQKSKPEMLDRLIFVTEETVSPSTAGFLQTLSTRHFRHPLDSEDLMAYIGKMHRPRLHERD